MVGNEVQHHKPFVWTPKSPYFEAMVLGLTEGSYQERSLTLPGLYIHATRPQLRPHRAFMLALLQKAPCSVIVYTSALKQLWYHHFGVYVYTIKPHGALGSVDFLGGRLRHGPCGTPYGLLGAELRPAFG